MFAFGGRGFRRFLASSSSIVALAAGAALAPTSEAFAACATSITGTTPGCTNATTITGINIHSANVTSAVVNSGTISTNGISVNTSSTLTGGIASFGTLIGGIHIDATSTINGTVSAIHVYGLSLAGGITNAGSLSSSGFGANGVTIGVSTFSGSIVNAGTGTITEASGGGIMVNGVASFAGGVSNAGNINAKAGISVSSNTVFGLNAAGGGIVNSGTISSSNTGIFVRKDSTFFGGITNSGTITQAAATGAGVKVRQVSSFVGNVSNSGTITGAHTGIAVVTNAVFGTAIAGGGIVNSNTINALSTGISVSGNSTFLGGITSSGTISAGNDAIFVIGGVSFGGGISTAGTVTAVNDGIRVGGSTALGVVSTFSGGITNSGTVTVTNFHDVLVQNVSTFSGGIVNAAGATIASTAKSGILVFGISNFAGNISNAGTIDAGVLGIAVATSGSGGKAVSTFTGNIVNSGTIAAQSTAIQVGGVSTFQGAITNSGTISSANAIGILVETAGTVTGGISNGGTITANHSAIRVALVSSFAGGIANSGTLTSTGSTGILVASVSSFAGGIANSGSGTIAAQKSGIFVAGISNFAGNISNAGTINAGAKGIAVGGTNAAFTVSTFTGNIVNSGTITAHNTAIAVAHVSTFSGGITNSGTITSANLRGIFVENDGTLTGGIANGGSIASSLTAIDVQFVSSFAGGIANSGTLTSAHNNGIEVASVTNFAGGISNGGTIATGGETAIQVADVSTFAGGITNNGSIASATRSGIQIVSVSSFSGGISNAGTIAGVEGIAIRTGVSFVGGAIVNSGTIQGTGGTAIDLSAALNAVTVRQAGGTLLGTILFSSHGDTLSGYGTVVGNITQGNATISPTLVGSGVLKIAGNLTQGPTSNTVIEISPAAAAQLLVTGTASLAGGLTIAYDPGTYSAKTYDLVHAGGVVGTYATTNSIALPANATQTLTYTPTDLNLALSGLSVSTTTGSFGDAADVALSGAFDIDDIVFDHFDELQFGQGADQVRTALAGASPIQIAMNGPLAQLAQASTQLSDAIAQYGGWVRGTGDFLSADNHGSASGFSANGGGVIAGIDHPLGPVTIGIAGGYSGTDLRQNDGESGDIQTIRGMLYAHYVATPQILVDGIAGFAFDRIHTKRPIAALGNNATESHNGYEENLAVQAGYVLPWQGFSIIPRVGAQYLHFAENGFSESGGSGFDLTRGHQSTDSFQPMIGIAALKPFMLDNGMRVTPEFKLTYSHELLNPGATLALTTPSGVGVPAAVVTPAHNTITLGPSATLRLNDSVNLFADYKLSIGIGRSLDHVIAAGARVTW